MDLNLEKIDTLVLSGGSILGITYLGLFKKIQESHSNLLQQITTYYGTSIGSVVSVAFSLGYQPEELYNELKEISIESETDLLHFSETFGLDKGTTLLKFLMDLLQKKCSSYIYNITLEQLYNTTKKVVNITTCCVETGEILFLNKNNFPGLKLVHAIRMTISIPIYFTPVVWKGKHYIDAGVTLNFPFKEEFISSNNVLGVNIIKQFSTDEDLNLLSYISNIVYILINQKPIESQNIITIKIPSRIKNSEVFDFNVSQELKEELFQIGYSIFNS